MGILERDSMLEQGARERQLHGNYHGNYAQYSQEGNSVQGNDIPRQVGVGVGVGVVVMSTEDQVEIIVSKLILYEHRLNFEVDYDNLAHPIHHVKKLRNLSSEHEWLAWLAMVVDHSLLHVVLTALPQVISQPNMNIEDVADDAVDKESEKEIHRKQGEWLDNCFFLIRHMMRSLPLVIQFTSYLAKDENFKKLFLQDDDGNCGFRSNIIKTGLSGGMFYAVTYSLNQHGKDMEAEVKDTSIRVLGKLSSMIDSKVFGMDGALKEISHLIQHSDDEIHKNILFHIFNDIYIRQDVGADLYRAKRGSINGH